MPRSRVSKLSLATDISVLMRALARLPGQSPQHETENVRAPGLIEVGERDGGVVGIGGIDEECSVIDGLRDRVSGLRA